MSAPPAPALLDAHVHFHAGFSRRAFFDAALRNLARGARECGLDAGSGVTLGLLLTESAGADAFGAFAREAGPDDGGAAAESAWRFRAGAEAGSLWAVHQDGSRILLVAGRQLVTHEGLEVLALGCAQELPDGMGLRVARDAVIEAGGVPVVPWGFGKWWGARGRALAALIAADSPGRWYLGDNAGRPHLWRRPALFAQAARHGVFVLPGSDPLPLRGQEVKAGRCGFVLPRPLDGEPPVASVIEALRACSRQPETFGRYEGLARFGRDQVAMQLRKRRSRDVAGRPAGIDANNGAALRDHASGPSRAAEPPDHVGGPSRADEPPEHAGGPSREEGR